MMRVDLAAQVLSGTVSKALSLTGGEVATETIHFVSMMDHFFDYFNVGNYTAGKLSRNPFKEPYRSVSDFRLNWLENDFLDYLDRWEKAMSEKDGFSPREKKAMLLSPETMTGLRFTVRFFVEFVRDLSAQSLPGTTPFISRRLTQDPLEKFFGLQCQRGRVNENPNVKEFLKNTQALRVIQTYTGSVHGNCRGNDDLQELDEKESAPLSHRPGHLKR